jgi:long-chain fatty acid transport protein|nr:MAG: aromatic hydrocarbon degradation protein [Bacteroidota bacterium]
MRTCGLGRGVLLLLTVVGTAYGGGYSIYEQGARASGLAGAYTAYGRHVSTIFYNPAGLALLQGWHSYFGSTLILPQSRFRGPLPYALAAYRSQSQQFWLPNLYASRDLFASGFVLGVGLYTPYGLGLRWPEGWPGRGIVTEIALRTLFLQPTLAYRTPLPGLSLGVGLSYSVLGEVVLDRAVVDFIPEGRIRLEGDQEGAATGLVWGILYEPVPHLGVGFTYRGPITLRFRGTARTENLPASAFPPSNTGKTELKLPAHWALGVRWSPNDRLTVLADYLWWGWSRYDTLRLDFAQETAVLQDQHIPRLYRDTYQIRAGLEYQPQKKLTLRFGVAFDKNPVPDETLDPTLPDADRWIFAAGMSYAVTDRVSLDASYTFVRFRERRNTSAETGFYGIYNSRGDLPSLGVTIAF